MALLSKHKGALFTHGIKVYAARSTHLCIKIECSESVYICIFIYVCVSLHFLFHAREAAHTIYFHIIIYPQSIYLAYVTWSLIAYAFTKKLMNCLSNESQHQACRACIMISHIRGRYWSILTHDWTAVAGKMFLAFPAHAQPTIMRIW